MIWFIWNTVWYLFHLPIFLIIYFQYFIFSLLLTIAASQLVIINTSSNSSSSSSTSQWLCKFTNIFINSFAHFSYNPLFVLMSVSLLVKYILKVINCQSLWLTVLFYLSLNWVHSNHFSSARDIISLFSGKIFTFTLSIIFLCILWFFSEIFLRFLYCWDFPGGTVVKTPHS